MTQEQFAKICDVFEEEGIDHETRDDYSGRGMYGKTCPAFVVDDPMLVAWACGKAGICIINDLSLRVDSMGMDKVVY